MSRNQTPITRRDATGHMDAGYAQALLAESREYREDHGRVSAFNSRPRAGDELGDELGAAFVQSATSGEEAEPGRKDQITPEEDGGPFVISSAVKEYTTWADASDIEGATREPFPKSSKADA
jgi:hypothetical protein